MEIAQQLQCHYSSIYFPHTKSEENSNTIITLMRCESALNKEIFSTCEAINNIHNATVDSIAAHTIAQHPHIDRHV